MNRTISVKHTKDRHGRPLAVIDGLPGEGAELDAAQLRLLAEALEHIAVTCDQGVGVAHAWRTSYEIKG